MASSKISLKLLIDNKAKKVLFAEAGKEFVDFVFSLLTLPIGAVAKLVSAGTMDGSVGRLYESVDRMGSSYLQPGTDRSDLLQPKVLHPDARELLLLRGRGGDDESPIGRFRLYTCAGYCATAAAEANVTCPQCKLLMATEVSFVLPYAAAAAAAASSSSAPGGDEGAGGYVKGVVTYMVTDGLEVTPMSAISSITLINKFTAGKDVELAEKFVTVGTDEGLALLKAVLRSDTVLSDVFLARKK
ncbi:hypothetical protein BDA96_09G017800 [Sorghum bicolor]|uniref:DUF674 domain-containing protein n=1 Tax=Sorghum bicolor TaxID=4558 RepID=A0A921QAF4_SORBI|nr:hypothetical protein BDA96_09G017800 [Sorghum bicolor]